MSAEAENPDECFVKTPADEQTMSIIFRSILEAMKCCEVPFRNVPITEFTVPGHE